MGELTKLDRLKRYAKFEAEIEYLREKIAQKKAKAQYSPRPMGEAPGRQITGDRMERGVIAYLTDGADAEAQLLAIEAERGTIRAAIDALPDPHERMALRYRYLESDPTRIEPMTMRELAKKLYRKDGERWRKAAERLHNDALAHLALADINEKSHP